MDPSAETFQLQKPILHQSKCISKAGPLGLRQVLAEYKGKVPDVSDSHGNIGTLSNSTLELQNFKISRCTTSKLQKNY